MRYVRKFLTAANAIKIHTVLLLWAFLAQSPSIELAHAQELFRPNSSLNIVCYFDPSSSDVSDILVANIRAGGTLKSLGPLDRLMSLYSKRAKRARVNGNLIARKSLRKKLTALRKCRNEMTRNIPEPPIGSSSSSSSSSVSSSSVSTSGVPSSSSSSSSSSGSSNLCGDGNLNIGIEECDDGNIQDSDGCRSNCQKQSGYNCIGSPSVCTTTGLNVYHIGHSLVNRWMPEQLEDLAIDAGYNHDHMRYVEIPAPLQYKWEHPSDFPDQGGNSLWSDSLATGNFDILVLTEGLPLDITAANTTLYVGNFYDYAVNANPNMQVYLYETWYRANAPDLATWRTETLAWGAQWEQVISEVNAAHTGPDMYLVPAGRAMVRLHDEIQLGTVPDLTSITNIFRTNEQNWIHMNDIGNYFVALVHYATIYRSSPVGLTEITADQNGLPLTAPSPALAQRMQEIVWEVVSNEPLTGINVPSCGDGILNNGEQCDDGNTYYNDGCTSCAVDSGWWCADTTPSNCFIQNAGRDCSLTSIGLTNLMDLGTGTYNGYQGGLYPGGINTRPVPHLADGLVVTNAIQPLDVNGNPDPNGLIGMMAASMSNGVYEFNDWFKALADADPAVNSKLVIAPTARGSRDISSWADNSGDVWNDVNSRISSAGLTAQQIQVVWMKQAKGSPGTSATPDFPQHATELKNGTSNNGGYEQILRNLKSRFPNLRVVYVSSRTRAYTVNQASLNPEPYAYESGFAVKWLIEDQINGNLNFRGSNPEFPWITWGPYLWADGEHARSDGFNWSCVDTRSDDGTHPSDPEGRSKVAQELLDFFKTDPTTAGWFLEPN